MKPLITDSIFACTSIASIVRTVIKLLSLGALFSFAEGLKIDTRDPTVPGKLDASPNDDAYYADFEAAKWCRQGILHDGSFCCDSECGTCGGESCGARIGGESKCCHSGVGRRLCESVDDVACALPDFAGDAVIVDAQQAGHYEGHYACDLSTFVGMYNVELSQNDHHGIIIAGQGGSATRAAQEVVQLTGTHYFGMLSPTHDSYAARWGEAFIRHEEILSITGTVDYDPWNLPSELRQATEMHTCTTLTMLRKMMNSTKPWALKDPWLRIMLPFYTSFFKIKFVHVTRDLRNIHDTHYDERFAPMIRIGSEMASESRIQEVLDTSDSVLLHVKPGIAGQRNVSAADVKKYILFAYAWAEIELTLYKKWTSNFPGSYFHLSEKMMTDETTSRATAISLAQFLGNMYPDERTLSKMMAVYHVEELETEEARSHWRLMHAIVTDVRSLVVREALTTFGYEVDGY